jgi:hypothetical protein
MSGPNFRVFGHPETRCWEDDRHGCESRDNAISEDARILLKTATGDWGEQ